MKNKYIQLILREIQNLESKVANLTENQNVSFSFFKESFKQTQEIARLLHELEFAQIEDMKGQMGKLVQFLSESETSKPITSEELEKVEERTIDKEKSDKFISENQKGIFIPTSSASSNDKLKDINEDYPQFEEKQKAEVSTVLENDSTRSNENLHAKGFIKEDTPQTSNVDPLHSTIRSLNDLQPANQTILDNNRSISLNDRFLFQRELFENDRHAMNNMMLKLQSFNSYNECEEYLKEKTNWNFKDKTVEKFLEMLKKGFK